MRHSATATVAFLNEIFGHCDRLVARHGLEKIATGFGSRYCPGPPGRLSALSVFLCKSFFYGVFVWARRALNTQKRRFPARAVPGGVSAQAARMLGSRREIERIGSCATSRGPSPGCASGCTRAR
jgi:hypothetical protein